MKTLIIGVWVVTVFFCIVVFFGLLTYFCVYKKNINKVLENKKPKHLIEPYKVVYTCVVLLLSVAITATAVSGVFYSERYFKIEHDFYEEIDKRTVFIDTSFDDDTVRRVDSKDVDIIKQTLMNNYPGRGITAIPIYNCTGGININGFHNLYALDKENSGFIGLQNMEDDVVYFDTKPADKVEIQISVTKVVNSQTESEGTTTGAVNISGFVSDRLEILTFKAENGVAAESLVSVIRTQYMVPSLAQEPIAFVTMDTFYEIVSVLLDTKVDSATDFDAHTELVHINGVYVCVDSLGLVNSVSSLLTENNYNAYAPVDSFELFENAMSATFTVFIVASSSLIIITAINVFLTIKTMRRSKKKLNKKR